MPPNPSSASSSAPQSGRSQQQQQQQQQRQIASSSSKMMSTALPRPIPQTNIPLAPSHSRNNANGSSQPSASTSQQQPASATWKTMTPKRERPDNDDGNGFASSNGQQQKTKKPKRKGGKACVYCRRSHMVCEGGRPCERCIKRDIAHLCRDVTPPSSAKKGDSAGSAAAAATGNQQQDQQAAVKTEAQPQPQLVQQQQQPQQLVYDTGSSSWPLLPDTTDATNAVGSTSGAGPSDTIDLSAIAQNAAGPSNVSGGGWGVAENAEFGILSDMLKTLRVPTLPGGFVDVLSQVVRNTNGAQPPQMTVPQDVQNNHTNGDTNGTAIAGPSTAPDPNAKSNNKGKGKAEPFSTVSRIEQYLLAAADQPDGSRASRLTQVIRAKYEAGLLKPYDYIKGYERMNRWMDSGRAARVESSSRASSPTKGSSSGNQKNQNQQRLTVPPPPSGSSISPESRRRILAALEGFRPRFRRIAKELTDLDLVFVEEANERLMLQYDRALASIHTPSCIWRRTGEIQKANQEFAKLTGIPAPLFRNGQLCVYELMDEDSAVRFWEGYGKVAFEKGQSHMYTHCTLKIPLSLTRAQPSRTTTNTPAQPPTAAPGNVPDFQLPQSVTQSLAMTSTQSTQSTGLTAPTPTNEEEYRVIKTCFSITIRRDRYGIPVAIMGQWIPIGQ